MNSSTGLPALTSIMTRRGRLSFPTISSIEWAPDDLGALGFLGQELVDLGDGAVVGDDGEAVVVHVEDEVLAHDGQADEGDVALRFHGMPAKREPRADGSRLLKERLAGNSTSVHWAGQTIRLQCSTVHRNATTMSIDVPHGGFA